ncbi:MAG: FtsW/RodA/SpoVE family cell cycle protein [Candidatus Nomurabacteria bacterium]|nr:FtsW/RodA/SpoVE family cell cycle protein [Candidatus Nomurabacteria bacterium]
MRKHKSDLLIALFTVILMAVGLIIIYAIGPSWAQFQNTVNNTSYSSNFFFSRQLLSVGISLGAFFFAYKFRYEWVEKAGKWLLIGGFALCALMAILGLAQSSFVNCSLGACRWLNFPFGFNLQPVEVLKLGILVYMAGLIAKRQNEGILEKKEFWIPFVLVMALTMIFVAVIQKDLGSTVVITFMMLCMLVVSNMRWRYIGIVVGALLLIGTFLIVLFPHRMERMMSFSGDGNTHHIENALIAIGTGGFWGVGIGNSVQATGYLPESINDSVFAVMGETFGFVGLMAVVLLFAALLGRILKVAQRLYAPPKKAKTPSRKDTSIAPVTSGYFVVIGVFAWVAGHVIINIMGMTAIIPMKGITLPFLSYGGTSMMFVAAAMGLCLQLSGWTKREVINEDSSGRRGERRTYHASSRHH